jgi:hypothetical protein
LGSTSVPPTILLDGINWYFPLEMTEAGKRGKTMRWGWGRAAERFELFFFFNAINQVVLPIN